MLEGFLSALDTLVSWPNILLPLLGTVIGLVVGAMPGLGAAAGIALVIPLTYAWGPEQAFLLIASIIGGTSYAGSITAILINTPGESANAATLLDGYPMAKKGEASTALSVSATASAVGAVFGLIVFLAILPLSRQLILKFSYPETFMIAVVGLFIIALISRGSLVKGLIAGGLGFVLSFVGRDLLTGVSRFTFGSLFLDDGLDFIAVLIGLFALSEAMSLLLEPNRPPEERKLGAQAHWRQIRKGAALCFRYPRILLQSSVIGTVCGVIPGIGGSVSAFIAYATAKQGAKDPEKFGTGDPRGVIATEASIDAKDGGALLPTIALGVPGSAVWAVVLGAFLIHGIAPGREMLTDHLDIVFLIVLGLLISNILTSVIGLSLSRFLAPIARMPAVYVAPIVFVVSLVGAYSIGMRRGDIVVALLAGVAGFVLKRYGFSLVPVVIGLILGRLVEQSFGQTALTTGLSAFLTRPFSLGIFCVGVLLFALPIVRQKLAKRRKASSEDAKVSS
ncbi:MAG: tricarboxylic transporter [Streptosporangiales bacterium]|nr:tricarboxylic transporter [Streptosporangiales bacterium]